MKGGVRIPGNGVETRKEGLFIGCTNNDVRLM